MSAQVSAPGSGSSGVARSGWGTGASPRSMRVLRRRSTIAVRSSHLMPESSTEIATSGRPVVVSQAVSTASSASARWAPRIPPSSYGLALLGCDSGGIVRSGGVHPFELAGQVVGRLVAHPVLRVVGGIRRRRGIGELRTGGVEAHTAAASAAHAAAAIRQPRPVSEPQSSPKPASILARGYNGTWRAHSSARRSRPPAKSFASRA